MSQTTDQELQMKVSQPDRTPSLTTHAATTSGEGVDDTPTRDERSSTNHSWNTRCPICNSYLDSESARVPASDRSNSFIGGIHDTIINYCTHILSKIKRESSTDNQDVSNQTQSDNLQSSSEVSEIQTQDKVKKKAVSPNFPEFRRRPADVTPDE
ncbi:uncharacterized protein I206_101980 [Kwoniella pini CBS 10737]|uniref:Uncharacterized protein n=1 Tax=Kwoniella pini CBS 10737 TaxID=1296096 RepID=A0A1B9HV51_9TREE|nr:uncharacterized protein I206_06928 [Kwoniella pini CBS 10737]OCF47150.1 hypothetical protein I206_06928 [Kwoniella pini CBS 10737]